MAPVLNGFEGCKVQHHYSGHWKGWALKIETFLGLKWHERWAQKSLDFQGPPLQTPFNAPRNDVAPLKTITYRAIKTTGTLIVKMCQ
jgi:hypothetical protein